MASELKIPDFHLLAKWEEKPIVLEQKWMQVLSEHGLASRLPQRPSLGIN